MSIATQQAKERQNQTPGMKVMAETVFVGGLIRGGAGARGSECGHPGWSARLGGEDGPGVPLPGDKGCGQPGWSAGLGGGSGCPGVTDLGGNSWENGRNWWISWRERWRWMRERLDPLETKQ